MSRRTKFRKGAVIRNMHDLMRRLDAGEWVYMRHKVQHPGWVSSMRLNVVSQFVRNGWVAEAVRNVPEPSDPAPCGCCDTYAEYMVEHNIPRSAICLRDERSTTCVFECMWGSHCLVSDAWKKLLTRTPGA